MPKLPTGLPHDLGITTRSLAELVANLDQSGLDPHTLMVARNGSVVLECSWRPYRLGQPALVYSVSKTITALAVGFLVSEGRLKVTDRVDAHLDLPNPARITVHQLLTMTTGHDRSQTLRLPLRTEALLTTGPAHEPGTHFAYNSAATLALSDLVTAITGQRLSDYLQPRLFAPLGIGRRWWTPHGESDQGFSGLHLSTDDMIRIAILLADGGRFAGQQVVASDWVTQMLHPWADTRPHDAQSPDYAAGYGYQVWRSRHGYRADGSFGQFAIAVPGKRLAIAYQGASRDQQGVLSILMSFIDTVSDETLPADATASARLARQISALDAWRCPQPGGLDPAATLPVSDSPWRLEAAGDGWTIDAAGNPIAVGRDDWARSILPGPSGGKLLAMARGTTTADGSVSAHVLIPTSPHRIEAAGTVAGTLQLAWHTAPLWQVTLAGLAVPDWVINPATSPCV